jgi:hypothetical protein
VGLHRDTALGLGINDRDAVDLHIADATYRLQVRLDLELPQDVIGLPAGLPTVPQVKAPVWAQIAKVNHE